MRVLVALMGCWLVYFVGGFLLTPKINLTAHKPTGDLLWSKIVAYRDATGRFPHAETELLSAKVFTVEEQRLFLDRNFGHRKFAYLVDERLGPILTLEHRPGALYAITIWRQKTNAEPDQSVSLGPADTRE